MQFIKSTFGKFQQMHLFKHPGQLGCQLFVYKFNLLQYQFFTAVEFKFIFSWEMKCSFFFKIWELLAFSPSLKFTKIKLELFSIYLWWVYNNEAATSKTKTVTELVSFICLMTLLFRVKLKQIKTLPAKHLETGQTKVFIFFLINLSKFLQHTTISSTNW